MKFFYIENNLNSNISLFLVIVYSFFINIYFANFGTFPIDTFLHFDSSYRILKGEYPVKDYWIVSGFIIDFMQSIFFNFFGLNWYSYILHSSFMNVIVSMFTYFFISELIKNRLISFVYTLCFSTLAYTISGTPFVDHHATFFLLISTYLIIHFFKYPDRLYLWPIIIFVIFLSFLSKQVPFAYVCLLQGLVIFFFLIKEKSFKVLLIIFFSILITFLIFYIFLIFLKIDIKLFFTQYFEHPLSIGADRFSNFNISFESFLNKYKFLIIPVVLIAYFEFKNGFGKKNHLNFFLILSLGLGLLYHQILTKNQIFIYFLIPIFFSILHSEILKTSIKNKSLINVFLILSIILITIKYHNRFNENRKFHELNKSFLSRSVQANNIDIIFKSLKWVNPFFLGSPTEEMNILKKAKKILNEKEENIMLITHYSFFDSITKKNMNYPNRTFTGEGISYPMNEKKLQDRYKAFLRSKIKEKSIKEIYFFKHEKLSKEIINLNISQNCFNLKEDDIFLIYEIKCLD